MKKVSVVFPNSSKIYVYQTELNLIKGAIYDIIVDGFHTYTSYVTVVSNDFKNSELNYNGNIRTITEAKLIKAPKRKNSGIKEVFINKTKKSVTILWNDNVRTTVKCQDGDIFDEEKGIMACYMKRTFENRGYYNEIIKKAIKNANVI